MRRALEAPHGQAAVLGAELSWPLHTRASGEGTFRDLSGEQVPLGLNINCIYPTRTCP